MFVTPTSIPIAYFAGSGIGLSFGNLSFAHRPSAIDAQNLPGDELGLIGEEKNHCRVEIARLPDAASIERLLGGDVLKDGLIRRRSFCHRRFDQGRSDDVKSN